MLRAFWDESGSTDNPQCRFVGIGGLIASADSWDRFDPEWQRVLDEFGLPHFHAKDYAHWKGAFANKDVWREPRRRAVMQELLLAIAEAKPRVLGAVMHLDAWRALSEEEHGFFHDPWFCCMQEVVRMTAVHCHMEQESVATVFSQQDEFAGRAATLWATVKKRTEPGYADLGAFAMEDMRKLLPLQAADLVAYEIVSFAPELQPGQLARFPLRALVGIDPNAYVANIDATYLALQLDGARHIPPELRGDEGRQGAA
jgi:hypothetical protein